MVNVHLNDTALARATANSPKVTKALQAVGYKVSRAVRAQKITVGDVDGGKSEIPLPVQFYESDDRGFSVALRHPAGKAVQAKHGALTKAAAAAGFEVHS